MAGINGPFATNADVTVTDSIAGTPMTTARISYRNSSAAIWFTAASVCLSIGCGGGGSSSASAPTAPTTVAVAPTIRTIVLSPGSIDLVVGGSVTVSAIANFSDGSSRAIAPTWSSSASSVFSVDQNGVVRALATGSATITATASGTVGSVIARSTVNYAGRWVGQYRFLSCSAPPRWGGSYCANTSGTLYNVELNLGVTGSQATGSIRLGSYVGSVSGTIGSDGTLSLQGTYSATTPSGLVYSERIQNWQTRIVNGTTMTGRWDTIGLLTGESQTGFSQYEMVTVNKS